MASDACREAPVLASEVFLHQQVVSLADALHDATGLPEASLMSRAAELLEAAAAG